MCEFELDTYSRHVLCAGPAPAVSSDMLRPRAVALARIPPVMAANDDGRSTADWKCRAGPGPKEKTLPTGQGFHLVNSRTCEVLYRAGCVLNGTFLLNLGHAACVAFFLLGWKIGNLAPIGLRECRR